MISLLVARFADEIQGSLGANQGPQKAGEENNTSELIPIKKFFRKNIIITSVIIFYSKIWGFP